MIIKTFLFHRVSDERDSMWPPMKPALFTEIIHRLTRGYAVIPFEAYLADPAAFQTIGKIAVVLFDDGYKDNIEFAAPILQKFKCPASFYVVTGCIDQNVPTWTYLVDNLFQKTNQPTIELPYEFVPEKFKSVQLKINGGDNPLVKGIKPWMKQLSNAQRISIVDALMNQCKDVAFPENKMMSWDDVRQLKNAGFAIGSHSHTHPLLASLADEKEIVNELRVSKDTIQREIGISPLTISYPNGSFDDRVIRIAMEEGYRFGQAVEQRFYNTEKDNIFSIPRVELYQEPRWKVSMRMNGIYGRIKRVVRS